MMPFRVPTSRPRRWIVRTVALAATLLAVGTAEALATGSEALTEALTRELQLTRSAVEVRRAVASLERERESLRYTGSVLEHAAADGMRRWLAFDAARGERAVVGKRRARALHALAHGGAARLVFEGDASTRRDRIIAGRLLRKVTTAELDGLRVYAQAKARAAGELVSAARELHAADAAAQLHPMQAHALAVARRELQSAVPEARRASEQQIYAASGAAKRAHAELLDELRDARRTLAARPRFVRPVPGPVVGAFGTHTDPRTRLPMQRDGIELSAPARAEVRSIAAGRVVLVGPMPGYEQVVAIDHGDGRFSLTGRLWQLAVEEGQTVEAGQVLGRVAPPRSANSSAGPEGPPHDLGPTVYLELRHGERPVDPVPLLPRR